MKGPGLPGAAHCEAATAKMHMTQHVRQTVRIVSIAPPCTKLDSEGWSQQALQLTAALASRHTRVCCKQCMPAAGVAGVSVQPATRSAARPKQATRGAGSVASTMQAVSAAVYSSASASAASCSGLGPGSEPSSGLASALADMLGRPGRDRRPASGSRVSAPRAGVAGDAPDIGRGCMLAAASALPPEGGTSACGHGAASAVHRPALLDTAPLTPEPQRSLQHRPHQASLGRVSLAVRTS